MTGVVYKRSPVTSANMLYDLLASVGWEEPVRPQTLFLAFMRSSHLVAAWDGDTLVGLVRSMDDDCFSANIDFLVVHKDYQNRGIGTRLVNELLEDLQHIKYISVSPSETKNNSFYKRLGFETVEGSHLLQICK